MWRIPFGILVTVLVSFALENTAHAYIGPGAGFAVATSFVAVFTSAIAAIGLVGGWPFRVLFRWLFRKRPPATRRFKRIVILGLDGLDHGVTARLLDEGKLPEFAKLRDQGCFAALGSTLPPISPVAWSSFQTGVNPGKHNIFDFLIPDPKTYAPRLSSVEIRAPRRSIRLGRHVIPLSKPSIRLLRMSRPFWSVLSDFGVFSCILRVPISFPPEPLHGVQLSGMCVPDLRGTQGVSSYYTTSESTMQRKGTTVGDIHHVDRRANSIRSDLIGPTHPRRPDLGALRVPFEVRIQASGRATLEVQGRQYDLRPGEYSPWVPVSFRSGPGPSIAGLCRFLLIACEPEFELYVTPLQLDPEAPAMPISFPKTYSVYLAKQQGPFATLGLAEDTWGLNEQVLNDDQFRQQCLDTDLEREQMFFDGLDKVPEGLCVCVFDGSDRMQHMFWRYLDGEHPARPSEVPALHQSAIEDLYQRMDALVGRTMAKCNQPDTLLLVLSDHGFTTFRRGVDLNRWLELEGYLKVDDSRRGIENFGGVDWSQTRAFAIGLTGIFLNLRGRFSQGIVTPGAEARQLASEIVKKLAALIDPKTAGVPIRKIYESAKAYHGPYKDQSPDIIVGYERGYRVWWDTAIGKTSVEVFHDNRKAWSGDHCVDPSVVPGVLFCNRSIQSENIRLLDIAPTVLELFGIPAPAYMDGRSFSVGDDARSLSGASPKAEVAG